MLSVRHRRHDCSGETYTVYDVLDRGYTDHPMTASANCRRTRTRMHGAYSPTAERLSRTSNLILNILCCFICFFCVIDCMFVILFIHREFTSPVIHYCRQECAHGHRRYLDYLEVDYYVHCTQAQDFTQATNVPKH